MSTQPPTPNLRRGMPPSSQENRMVVDVPDRLRRLPPDPLHPDGAAKFWSYLDQQLNIEGSVARQLHDGGREGWGTVVCRECGTRLGLIVDVRNAVVLGVLNTKGQYDEFVLLGVDNATRIPAAVMRDACGPPPAAAVCKQDGDRPLTAAIADLHHRGLRPGNRPAKRILVKV